MIKNLNAGSGIAINNAHNSWPTFYNTPQSTGNTAIGQMRYNGSGQHIEVYDGNSWIMMTNSFPTIELSPHVQAVVAWAQTKMAEESRIRELATKHPAVADALTAVELAKEKLQVVTALCSTDSK